MHLCRSQQARKQYEEQCSKSVDTDLHICAEIITDESEKLRNAIRARDEELRVAEDNLQNSASDLAKVIRERDYLQKTVSSLESDLAEARSAVEGLEEQKTENLQLRETIDRLRLDLDELRAQARVIESGKSSSLSRSASGSDSLPASLSRNLGNELARRLRTGQADDGDETETEHDQRHSKGSSDSYEEEIITTRRRLKRPVKKALPPTIDEDGKPVHGETITLDVVDIGIQVNPRPVPTAVIAVQTESEPDVPAHVKRSALARDLQVDLDEVDRYVQEKAERARLAAISEFRFWQREVLADSMSQSQCQTALRPRIDRCSLAGKSISKALHRASPLMSRQTHMQPWSCFCTLRPTSSFTL